MAVLMALVGYGTILQGAICKSDFIGVLSAVCLASALLLALQPKLPRWARVISGFVVIALLAAVIYCAGQLDKLYMGHIAEYRYVAVEAALALGLNILAMLPVKQKAAATEFQSVRKVIKRTDK